MAGFLSSLPAWEAEDHGIAIELAEAPVQCLIHAVPEALSNSLAREHAFQSDHLRLLSDQTRVVGPLHLILIHRNATRTQSRNLLGVDDSTRFPTPFGVFVADKFSKVSARRNCKLRKTILQRGRDLKKGLTGCRKAPKKPLLPTEQHDARSSFEPFNRQIAFEVYTSHSGISYHFLRASLLQACLPRYRTPEILRS